MEIEKGYCKLDGLKNGIINKTCGEFVKKGKFYLGEKKNENKFEQFFQNDFYYKIF